MPSSPQNRRRGIGRIGGSIVDELNEIGAATGKPGIGTRLARELNQKLVAMNARVEAASGQRGTVKYGPMTRRDSKGIQQASMDLQGGRMVGLTSDPTDGSEPITLEYWRKHRMECRRFAQMHQDCIEEEEAAVAAAGDAGAIPWFWGWTVQHPHETDTLFAIFSATVEFGGTGYFYVSPFPLQADGSLTNVGFWIDTTYVPTTTFPGVWWLNFGLYNTNRELVWELGPYQVFSADGVYAPGVGRVSIDTTAASLPTGEYYLAVFLPSCLRILAVDADNNADILLDRVIPFHNSKYTIDNILVPNFPAVVPDTPHGDGTGLVLIPLLMFTDFTTIGFTG